MKIGDRVTTRLVGSSDSPEMELIYLGTTNGREFFMQQVASGYTKVSSWFHNPANAGADMEVSYSITSGSEMGFSQAVGLSASATFGLPGIGATEVTLSVEVGFSQMFSKETSNTLTFSIPPGKTMAAYESYRYVHYYWGLPGMAEGTVPEGTTMSDLLAQQGLQPSFLDYPAIGAFAAVSEWPTSRDDRTASNFQGWCALYMPSFTKGVVFYEKDTLSGSVLTTQEAKEFTSLPGATG